MAELPITVCRVGTPDGPKDYLTCVPHEQALSRGLAPEAIVGVLLRPLEPNEAITPAVFARNRAFVDFMHGLIARRGPGLHGLIAEAQRQGDGWIYIIDQRTLTPQGPVPPQDIIGAFEVRGGQVVAGSYRPSPQHMILSADGFVRLGAELQACLLEELGVQTDRPAPDHRS